MVETLNRKVRTGAFSILPTTCLLLHVTFVLCHKLSECICTFSTPHISFHRTNNVGIYIITSKVGPVSLESKVGMAVGIHRSKHL